MHYKHLTKLTAVSYRLSRVMFIITDSLLSSTLPFETSHSETSKHITFSTHYNENCKLFDSRRSVFNSINKSVTF